MNYSVLTTMYERDIRIHTVVTSHGPIMKKAKNVNNIFLPEILTFGRKHCSRLTVVNVRVNSFVQNSPSMSQRRERNQTRK